MASGLVAFAKHQVSKVFHIIRVGTPLNGVVADIEVDGIAASIRYRHVHLIGLVLQRKRLQVEDTLF